MKNRLYISIAALLATVTACDSGSDATVQHPDGYDIISFTALTERLSTRSNPYEKYDAAKHPATMGVLGYHDITDYAALTPGNTQTPDADAPRNPLFDNTTVRYNATDDKWTYSPAVKWNDFLKAQSFDFFAYMPYLAGAKVERSTVAGLDNKYTLSVPFSMPDGEVALTEQTAAPIICHAPVHKEGTTADGTDFTFDREVSLQFDQTLTAYQFFFRLDTRMNIIRQFRIKGVTLSGSIATAGTFSRSFSWSNGEWSNYDTEAEHAITWNITSRLTNGTQVAVHNEANENGDTPLVITSADYQQWGGTLYMIPDADFQPTITVTYDTEFLDQDGKTVVTRKNVKSSIALNQNNFSSINKGVTAMVNPIRILIQPRYLYVMADEDAYTGYLLVE